MLKLTSGVALAFAVISFVMFVYFAFATRRTGITPGSTTGGLGDAAPQSGFGDIAKLIEAVAKLADSFAKSGPMVMSLVSAILFFLLAHAGAGIAEIGKP